MRPSIIPLHLSIAILISVASGELRFLPERAPKSANITEDGEYVLMASLYFEDDGENLTSSAIRIYDHPDVGLVEIVPDTGYIVYTAEENDFGSRTFSYYACNSFGNCTEPVNFTVFIEPVNDPPSFGITNLTVLEDTVVSLALPQDLNATDPEDVLNADSFTVVTGPQVGELEYTGGTLVYTPPLNYFTVGDNAITFVLMVCDQDAAPLCENETISIVLTPVSDQGADNPYFPLTPMEDSDSFSEEFYVSFIKGLFDPTLTLSVTTRERQPVLFEVVTKDFHQVAAAVVGEFTVISLPTNLALEDSTERDKGIYVHTLDGKRIAVYSISLDSVTHDSSQVLPLPPDSLPSYTYMAVTRNDVPNSQMHAAALVATKNDTIVEISPKVSIVIGTDTISPNSWYNLTLQRLETLLITDEEDLTGTLIASSKPLSFFSGHQYATLSGQPPPDFHVEAIPPVEYWGSRFVLSGPSGGGNVTYRIVSGLECTTVHKSCTSLTSPSALSSFSLNVTEFKDEDVPSGESCWLESYYPVFVMQFSRGGSPPTVASVMVPPVNQYSNAYTLHPEFSTTVVIIPSEYYQPDSIYLNGSLLSSMGVSFQSVVYEGVTRAYTVELSTSVTAASTLYHSDPDAVLGVMMYGFQGRVSHAHIGGLRQVLWSGDDLFMFSVTNLDESSVTIMWVKPDDLVTSYNVTLRLGNGSVVEELVVLDQGVSFTDLRQLTYYTVTVRAVVDEPLKLPLVNTTTFRTDPCPHSPDIIFLVDASNSVTPEQFEVFKDFVANVSFGLKFGENWTHAGVITFGSNAHELIPLNTHYSGDSFRSAVENLTHDGSPASLSNAINTVVSSFQVGFGARGDSVHLVILLTSTPADTSLEPVAQLAIRSGVTLYTVGIGLGVEDLLPTTRSDLTDESDDTRVYNVSGYDNLYKLSDEFGIKFSDCFCNPPCLNGASCVKSLYCNCTDGWAGVACHMLDPTLFRLQKKEDPIGLLEGSSGFYIIWLNRQIFSDVYLDVMSVDAFSEVINSRFVFNTTNWMIPQDLEVMGVDDIIDRPDVYASTLAVSTASVNKLYRSQDMVRIALLDTDEPGVIVVASEVYPNPRDIPEGRWRTYDVSLPNRPTSPVVVLFFPVNTTFITIFPSYMVIEPDEWDIPKTLVVTATDDDIDRESPYSASFCMKLLSMDENFHRAAVPELDLSLEDNDYGDAVLSGSLSWRRVATPNRRTAAQFTLTLTLALSRYPSTAIGDEILLPGRFYYGDDSSISDLTLEVTEVVRDRVYIVAVGRFTHEYTGSLGKGGPWKAWFKYCCRRGNLSNNKETLLTITSLVNLHYQSSPVVPTLPIVDVQVASYNQSFYFVAASRGNPLVYSLGEAYNYQSSQASHPQGFHIDTLTGRISWNTSLTSPGYYSAQIVTRDLFSNVKVTTELFIRVQREATHPADSAPLITPTLEPLPPPSHILRINESFSLNFSAILREYYDEDVSILPLTLPPDGLQIFTLETLWVRNDTNATNGTVEGNSTVLAENVTLITASLEWTPAPAQLGDHMVCSVAVSSRGTISPPLCVQLRVFTSYVKAPIVDLHGNGEFPQIFHQAYTANGEPYTVPVFPSVSVVRLFSMPTIEHMEVFIVGEIDGHLEMLTVNQSFSLTSVSFESHTLPSHSNVILFRGRASPAAYTLALQSVGYSNLKLAPTEGKRLIVASVFDGISTSVHQIAYTEVTVTVPLQPPMLSTSGSDLSYRTTFFPNGHSVPIMNPLNSFLTDRDSPTLSSATLVLKHTADGENERIKVTHKSIEELSLPIVAEATGVERVFGRLRSEELVSTVSSTITVTDVRIVGDVEVVVDIRHSWIGDIKIELEHAGRTEILTWSPGGLHCARDHLYRTVFDEQAGQSVQLERDDVAPGVCRFRSDGVFKPYGDLNGFVGLPTEGDWTLIVSDLVLENDNGRIVSWAIVIQPSETHLHLTTPPVVPLLMVGGVENSWIENHRKWIESDGRIVETTVHVQLTYPYTSEVLYTPTLILTHPDGTRIQLTDSSDLFCAYGNFTYLIFDDRGNRSFKTQYMDACSEFQNGNQTGNGVSPGAGTVVGTTSSSDSSEILRMGMDNTSAILSHFNLNFNTTIPSPNYPTKISLVDLLPSDQPLSLLKGKTLKGEWILSVASEMEEVSLVGWSLRISREPNIDHVYDSMNHVLSFKGLDSPTNYEAVLKSVVYENDRPEPSLESVRIVQFEASDGNLRSNSSFPCSETFILIHHIEINLDPNNVTNASFPDIHQTFVEMQSPLHIADPENAVLSDPSFPEGLYQIQFTIEGYANLGMEGLSVDLESLGLEDAFILENSTNGSTYIFTLTTVESSSIGILQAVLRNVMYFNNAEELVGDGRTVRVEVRDLNGVYLSLVAQSKIDFTLTNDPPVLILNLDLHSDSFSNIVNFIEGEGPVPLADKDNLVLYDHDNENLLSVTVVIKNPFDGENDTLVVNVSGTNIAADYNSTGHQLLLHGVDSLENYRSVVSSVAYNNLLHSPGNPDTRQRMICFTPNDGVHDGREVVAIVTFDSVNDPPVVDLNGEDSGNNHYTVFVEEGGWIQVNPRATLFDIDDTKLDFVEIKLLNAIDGDLERLAVDNVTVTIAANSALIQQFHILTRSDYDTSTGILRIEMSGTNTVTDLQRVLQTLRYNNIADEPTLTTRVVEITANDGTASGPSAYVYIRIEPVNDSPYFKMDVMGFSPLMYEDEMNDTNDGFSVSDIARLIGDDDPDAKRGVAVVGVDDTNGCWEFQLEGGPWRLIPKNVTMDRALLMGNVEGNNIRFLPNRHFNGNVTISFVAWDVSNANVSVDNFTALYMNFTSDNMTNSTMDEEFVTHELTSLDGMYANARSKSNIDPFSNTTLTIVLEVVPVNDAPLIANKSVYLTTILEDDYNSAGDKVSVLLKWVQDVDGVDEIGAAIISAEQDNGTWQYSAGSGQTWYDFGSLSPESALLLSANTRVRFVPFEDFNGVVSFGYLAWDMTDDGLVGNNSTDTTVHDEVEGPYSMQNNTAYLVVDPVNDSPVVEEGMQLESILEDTSVDVNHGTSVSDIVKDRYVDVDAGSEVGIVVVGVDVRYGRWEYTCGSYPFRWESFIGDLVYGVIVPVLPIPERATLLSGNCRIRFLPHPHFNTEYDYDGYPRPDTDMPYLEVRGWDNTGFTKGRSGTYGNDATYAESSATNEYSHDKVVVTISVVSVNDPPILTLSSSTVPNFMTTFVEDLSPVPAVGQTLTLIDNDHLRLAEVNITIYGSYGTPDGYLGLEAPVPSNTTGVAVLPNKPPRVFTSEYLDDYCSLNSSVTRREELLLDTTQTDLVAEVVSYCPYSIRIYPDDFLVNGSIHKAQFQKVLRTIQYSNTIEEPVGGVRIIEFTVSDGVDSSDIVFTTVHVETVNDAPQLDLNDFVPDINNNVLFTEGDGATTLANSTGLTLIDHDDNYIQSVRVDLVNHPDGDYEVLLADTTGTNIVTDYTNFTLRLSGNDTLEAYIEVLRSVKYNNTYTSPGNPDESVREVRFFVYDGDKESRVAVSFVRFEGTNDVPYLDINGDAEGQDNTAEFREEMGPVSLVDDSLIVHDEDNSTLAYVTVQIVGIYDPGLEVLAVDNVTLTNIRERNSRNLPEVVELRHIIPVVSYNDTIGLLNISGLESLEDYRSILRTITYDNYANEPNLTQRVVLFTLNDGHLMSTPVYSIITMTPINDSPRFNNLSVIEPSFNEDEGGSIPVYDMAFLLIEDYDIDAERGIAIVDVDSSNGFWFYTLDSMNTTNISVTHQIHEDLDINHAVLLRAISENEVHFVPNRDFVGNSTITFAAWDASDGLEDGAERVVMFSNNGTDSFSFETRTITVQILPVNDAPVLNPSIEPRMTSILEDSVTEWPIEGDNVTLFISALKIDVDIFPSTDIGIAIVEVDSSNGVWQFTTDGGMNWTNISRPLEESSALVLSSQPEGVNRVRFHPNKDFNGESTFRYKLWDLTSGHTSGDSNVDTRTDPVTGAFSVDSTTSRITVEPVNDSPVLSGDTQLGDIPEDIPDMNNFGTFVRDILQGVFSDVDGGDDVGLAVVEVDLRFGNWYYTCDSGATTERHQFIGNNVFGQIAPRTPRLEAATLLLANCRIIFAPEENFNSQYDETGSPRPASDTPFIRIRGWDNTGTAEGLNFNYGIDTTSNPDNHRDSFSKEVVRAQISVLPLNDQVVLELGPGLKSFVTTFTEPIPPNRMVHPIPIVDQTGLSLTDVDNSLLDSMTISFQRYDGEEMITISTDGTDLSYNVTSDSTTGQFLIEVFPAANLSQFRTVLLSAMYFNAAEEPNATDRVITVEVTDTGISNLFMSSDSATTTIVIDLVNDPPELDLDLDIPDTYSFVTYTEGQSPVPLFQPNHSLIDHDNASLLSASVSISDAPDMEAEVLSANTSGTSISSSYSNTTGVLELFGPATVEEFEQVLATVSYSNTLSSPGNPSDSDREIVFVVNDGLNDSIPAFSRVMFIAVNNRPFLDVNGDSLGTTYSTEFREGEGAVRAVDANLLLKDVDNRTLAYIDVTITDARDGEFEILQVSEVEEVHGDVQSGHYSVWVFRPVQEYNATAGILRISGLNSIHEYQEVLKTLTYNNLAEEPLGPNRTLSFDAFDGLKHSIPVYSGISLIPINDSPFFNDTIDVISPSIYEDIRLDENHGYSLVEVAGDLILDNDRDSVKGIAIISADSRYGRWEYTVDFTNVTYVVEYPETNATNTTDYSGSVNDSESLFVFDANWTPLSEDVSIIEAVVLRVNGTTTRLRFVPDKDFNGESNLMFVAWDASDGLKDGSITDASDQSDTDPFSSNYRNLIVTVNKTNDAPLLSPISFNLTSILEDDVSSEGDPVEDLLSGIRDIDVVDEEYGIAVTVVDERYGTWQFSVDSGDNWTPMRNVSTRSAVLLRSSPPGVNRVRFVPVSDFNGFSTLTFVGWDLTSGEPSGTTGVDVLLSDPVIGPFSRNKTTAMIFVEQVNDSPSLGDGSSLFTILEDLPVMDNNGTSVGEIVNGTFYDVDDVPDLNFAPFTDVGIAVVGVNLRYGEWQYRCPNRNEWAGFIGDFIYGVYLPRYPRVERATLLLSDCRIRFLPNLHFNTLKDLNGDFRPDSDVPFITIRGWDNTGPSAGKSGMYGQDTTYNQDSHLNEFSFETSTATINITSVNDIPLLNISSSDKGVVFRTEFVEDSPFVRVTDPLYVRLVDIDNARLESVTISVVNSLDPDSELIDIVDDSPIVEVNGSTVEVTLKNTVHRFQIMYSIYSNDSSVSQSSLMIMSIPGHESVAIEAYEELLRHVVYKNLHPEPTNGTREIVFVVDDGEDVNNRVRAFVDVTLRAENRPVVVPNKMIVYFTEGDLSPIPLTSSLLTLTDRDHNEYFYISGARLTFGIVPRSPLEYLSVNLSVVDLPFSLVQHYSPGYGTLTVSGEAPVSQYQEVLRSILYHNTEGEPRPGPQPVSIQVTDTHNLTSQPVSIVVEVTVVNDNPPEISAPTQPYKYVEGSSYALLHNIFISDNDTGGGDLYIYQVNATITNPMDLDNEELDADRSWCVDVMFDDDHTLILTGPASVSDFQNVLSTLRYLNRAEEPSTDIRIIELEAKDANFTSDVVSIFVSISLVNDLPVVDLNGPRSPDVDIAVNYVEGSGPQPIVDPFNLTVHDNDHNYLVGVIVELTNPYDSPLEFLSVNSTISNISSDYNVSSAVLTLSGRSSLEDYQSVLRSVTYENKEALPGLPNTTARIVTFVAFDGDAYSMTSTAMVMFDSVNDPPLFDLNGEDPGRNYCTSFTEEGPPILLSSRDMMLIDVDNTSLESVTVRITNLHDGDMEVLTLSRDFYYKFPAASVDYNSGVLTVSGLGDVSHFREAASSVQYQNLADEPNFEPRIVEFVANDGLLDSLPYLTKVNMTPVNDIPRVQLQLHPNVTFDFGMLNVTNMTISDNGTEDMSGLDPVLNGTRLNDTMDDSMNGTTQQDNVTATMIPYRPAPYYTCYTENGAAIMLTNPQAVLVQDDDDSLVSSITIRTDGVRDVGHESVFFKLDPSSDLAKKLEPYDFSSCPIHQERYSRFTVSGTFTLSEVEEALRSLHYCNTDEFSISGLRNVSVTVKDIKGAESKPQFAYVEVKAVNDAPALREDAVVITMAVIDEDGNYTLPALSYFFDHEENLTGSAIQILFIDPEVGEATVDEESGDVVYSSALNDYGVRTVWYQACDSQEACSSPVNLTIIINPVNDPPNPVPPLVLHVVEDTPITESFTRYFADPEDDLVPNSTYPRVTAIESPIGGSYIVSEMQTFTFEPAPNNNVSSHLNFTVCDSNNACTNISVVISITPVNDKPEIVVEYPSDATPTFVTMEDTSKDIPILVRDVEDRDYLSVAFVRANNGSAMGTLVGAQKNVTSEFIFEQRSFVVYQPNHNFCGEDIVTISATDSQSGYTETNISVTVLCVNDPPSFGITNLTVLEDTVVSLALPQDLNVTDPEDVLNADSFTVVTGPQVGELEYTGGTLVYTPPEHYNTPTSGSPITFTLQVCDNDTENQLCTNQSLSITYLAVNDAPLLPPIPVVIYEDNPYVSDLTSLISDVEESVVASDRIILLDPLPRHGTVTYDDSTGILRYQPNHNYHGSDAIYFQACDAVGLCNFSGIVNLTILAVNDPPQAEMFTAYVTEDEYDLIAVYSRISDVETIPSHLNEYLRLHIVDPASGELVDRLISHNNATLRVFDAHGIIGYDPMMEFVGMDGFTYAVCDLCHIARNGELGRVELPPECLRQIEESGGGQLSIDNRNITCVEREVRVVVRNVDDVPVVSDISALVPVGESVTISPFNESRVSSQHSSDGYLYTDPNTPVFEQDDLQLTLAADMGYNLTELLLNTDSDVDESSLRVFSPPSNGNVTVERNDQYPHFVYKPNVDFQGYDTFEYEVCDKNRNGTATVHCSKATARIFVFGEGPTISSVVAVSSKVASSGETLDFDSKVSRGDKILINFAVPTNMPPYGEANRTVTREDIDQIFEFDSPFISDQIAPSGYEGRWIDNSLFELEIVDEGYPQPEVPIGEWRVRVANGVSPCGGFDPVTRHPVDSSMYCLQDAKGTSFHSTAVSNPITGNFGLTIPEILSVKIIPDAPSKKVELTKDIFLNTQIVIYLKEPLSHYQLELYCQKEAHFLLNPTLINPNAKLTLTGCQNLLSTTENAAVRYSDNIAIYEELYLSKRKRSTEEDNSRTKRQAGLTELPLYSEITFKVVDLSSTSTMAVDPATFVDEVKRNFNYTALADVVSSTSGVPISAYVDYRGTSPALTSPQLSFEHSDSTTPSIVNVTGMSSDDVFNSGDTIRITFDRNTNTPDVFTKEDIDKIFNFEPSIGDNYGGGWLDLRTLQITIITGSELEIVASDFTINFQPTTQPAYPVEKPWCVSIDGVCSGGATVGVCDQDGVSCRAFEPWTGITLIRDEVPTVPTDIVSIVVPIVVVFLLILLAICIAIGVYVGYKHWKKRRDQSKAQELVKKWRGDKDAPGKDDKEGAKPWSHPPDVPVMRPHPDPFSSNRDTDEGGPSAGPDPFRNLPDIRPPTAQPFENLPPIPPHRFVPRSGPRIGSPVGPISMPARPEPTELGLPPLTKAPTRQPQQHQLPPLKGNLGMHARRALGSNTSDTSLKSVPGALRPARLPSLSVDGTSPTSPSVLKPAPVLYNQGTLAPIEDRGKGPTGGKKAIKKVSPDVTTEEETQESSSDKGESPKTSPLMSPTRRLPPPSLPGITRPPRLPQLGMGSPPPMSPPGMMSPRRSQVDPFALPPGGRPPTQPKKVTFPTITREESKKEE